MIEWWNSLEMVQRVFTLIAIPATLIMIIQTIMLLMGWIGDGDADVDDGIDSDGDGGLALFSVRGIVAMLAVTGWSAVALLESEMNQILAVLIAIVLGLLTLLGMAYFMRAVYRMQTSGNIDVGNAVFNQKQNIFPPDTFVGDETGAENQGVVGNEQLDIVFLCFQADLFERIQCHKNAANLPVCAAAVDTHAVPAFPHGRRCDGIEKCKDISSCDHGFPP
jgi:hypothetical protein